MKSPALWLLAAVACLGMGLFAGGAALADVLGFVALVLACLVAVVATSRWPHLRAPVLLGLATRVTLALMQVYVVRLPASGEDDVWMERQGWIVAQLAPEQRLEVFHTGSRLYSWVIGWLYAFTDRSPLMIGAVNVALGTGVVLATALLAQALWSPREGRQAAWVTAFMPMLMLMSAITLREMAVTFPYTVAVLGFVHWQRTDRLAPLAAGVVLLVVAAGFHSVIIFALAGALFLITVRALQAARLGRGRALVRVGGALLLAGLAALLIVRSGWGLDKFGSLEGISEERLATVQEVSATGRSSYLGGLEISGPVSLVVQLPLRAAYFLFTPFPWMVREAQDLFGFVDAVVYVLLVFFAFRALRTRGAAARARALPVLVLGGVVLAVFAASVSNYGTGIRHRAKTAPLLVALAVGGTRRARRAALELELAAAAPAEEPALPAPAHAGSPA